MLRPITIVTLALALGILTSTRCVAASAVVADDECDTLNTNGVTNANCPPHTFVCTASFGGFTVTKHGTAGDTVEGAKTTCNSCDQCNPDPEGPPPPSTNVCTVMVSVTYGEEASASRSYTVGNGILSQAWIEAEASAAFQQSATQSVTFTANCGTETLPSCSKMDVWATMGTLEGIEAEATVTLSWTCTKDGYPSDDACPDVTTSGIFFQNAGTDTVTATGTKAGNGECRLGQPYKCP